MMHYKNDVPEGFVLLQRENGQEKYAACMTGRFAGWLMWKHPDGQWVSQRKLEQWELMQVEDRRDDAIVHETAARQSAAPGEPVPESARDWTEDFAHENGNYMNTCSDCKETFMGYKRRFICKVCAAPIADPEPVPQGVPEGWRELAERTIDRLSKAQIFDLVTAWRKMLAAPTAPTATSGGEAVGGSGRIVYQITGWGETDFPEVTFADTLDAAKNAIIAMVYDDPAGGKDQAAEENLLHGLDGDAELPWEVCFEIGGVEVRKVFVRPDAALSLYLAPPSLPAASDAASVRATGLLKEALAWIENSSEPAPSLCKDIRALISKEA